MHILLGLLALLGGAAFWWWRIKMIGQAADEVTDVAGRAIAKYNRYKFRKREASRRLEKTATNLTRLYDILRELELQLEESEKQLERYRKYKEAQVELKALELELAIQEWSRLQQQIEELRGKLLKAKAQVAELEELSGHAREALEDECADVLLYLLLIADRAGIDLEAATLAKLAKNEAKYPVEKSYGNARKYDE